MSQRSDRSSSLTRKLRDLLLRERELNTTRSQMAELRAWMGRVQEITKALSRAETTVQARELLLSLLLRNAPYELAALLCDGELVVHGAAVDPRARACLLALARDIHRTDSVEVIEFSGEDDGDVRWALAGSTCTEGEEPLTLLVARTARTAGYYPEPWDAEIERMGYLLSTITHVYAAVGYRANLTMERNRLADQVRVATHQLEQALGNAQSAAQAAQAASRAKTRFLANMSHELRTPMNGILGAIQLLRTSDLPPEHDSLVTLLHDSSELLLLLLNDILDTSRIEAGKLEIVEEEFDIRTVIAQVAQTFRLAAANKGLRLVERPAADVVPRRYGDAKRIRQVLMNLVGNAIKFTHQGTIELWVSESRPRGEQPRLRFEVLDTGIGIAPEDFDRVFDSFAQIDASPTRRFAGSGLGLAICKGLVDAMGGEIGVRSELSQGSCFWFELPLRTESNELSPEVAHVERPPPLATDHPLRVLVAEDNIVNQRVVRRMLERLGCDVDVVDDGLAAVEATVRSRYDIILMDIEMPRLNGLEATAQLRELGRELGHDRIPVVALTAHAFAEDRARCMAAGMSDFLAKPVKLTALQRTLAEHTSVRVAE